MEFVFNELSVHGQYDHVSAFMKSFEQLMQAREAIRRCGMVLRCYRSLPQRQVTSDQTVHDAIVKLKDPDQRRLIMSWLTREGPFWDDDRFHKRDDWFEHRGEIVTDTALGEAAMRCLQSPQTLVSLSPSDWTYTPIRVEHVDEHARRPVDLDNAWEWETIEVILRDSEPAPRSWQDLRQWAITRCPNLVFSDDVIDSLSKWPFIPGAAERLQVLLKTLNALKDQACYEPDGRRNQRGQDIYNNHFVGDKAWFTDSSTSEKHEFQHDLTFPHPQHPESTLFCPWHGKVKIRQLRIHFSYPITATQPLYVVYIGPKLTKR